MKFAKKLFFQMLWQHDDFSQFSSDSETVNLLSTDKLRLNLDFTDKL